MPWLFVLLLCGPIDLSPPTEPVRPGLYATIHVTATDAELSRARIDCEPAAASLLAVRTLAGDPILLFAGDKPGRYTITVEANAWRRDLAAAIATAVAAGVDPATDAKLRAIDQQTEAAYPLAEARCIVEVSGADPTPPPVPTPAPGPKWILIVRESKTRTPAQANFETQLRLDPRMKPHTLTIVDPDAVDETGKPSPTLAPWLAKLTAAGVAGPGCVIASKDRKTVHYLGPVAAETVDAFCRRL